MEADANLIYEIMRDSISKYCGGENRAKERFPSFYLIISPHNRYARGINIALEEKLKPEFEKILPILNNAEIGFYDEEGVFRIVTSFVPPKGFENESSNWDSPKKVLMERINHAISECRC